MPMFHPDKDFSNRKMITIVDYEDSSSSDLGECVRQFADDCIVSSSEIDICRAEKIIFPGIGTASHAMKRIHLLNLFSVMRIIRKPILGIGLGMQLLADYSLEGNISCLGIFPGTAYKFETEKTGGVNRGMHPVSLKKGSRLFSGIDNREKFYFHHTHYLPESEFTTSTSENSITFSASVEKNDSFGVQFHPEKSGEAGLKLIGNFIRL